MQSFLDRGKWTFFLSLSQLPVLPAEGHSGTTCISYVVRVLSWVSNSYLWNRLPLWCWTCYLLAAIFLLSDAPLPSFPLFCLFITWFSEFSGSLSSLSVCKYGAHSAMSFPSLAFQLLHIEQKGEVCKGFSTDGWGSLWDFLPQRRVLLSPLSPCVFAIYSADDLVQHLFLSFVAIQGLWGDT